MKYQNKCFVVVDAGPEAAKINGRRRIYDKLRPYLRAVPVKDIVSFMLASDAYADAIGKNGAVRSAAELRFVRTGKRVVSDSHDMESPVTGTTVRVATDGVLILWLPNRKSFAFDIYPHDASDLEPPTFQQFMRAYYPWDRQTFPN